MPGSHPKVLEVTVSRLEYETNTTDDTEAYNAWPHETMIYDKSRDKVVLFYTSGSVHVPILGDSSSYSHGIRMRTIDNASSVVPSDTLTTKNAQQVVFQ